MSDWPTAEQEAEMADRKLDGDLEPYLEAEREARRQGRSLVPPPGSIVRDVLAQKLKPGDWIQMPDLVWRQIDRVEKLLTDGILVTFTDGTPFEWQPFDRIRVRR